MTAGTEPATTPAVDRLRLARWLELVSFALDASERERVDALCELADSLEAAWLAACAREAA